MAFKYLMKKCQKAVTEQNHVLQSIAEKMLRKDKEYENLMCSDLSNFALILDPKFANDYLNDDQWLRPIVQLPENAERQVALTQEVGEQSIFTQLLDSANSRDGGSLYEINFFLRATSFADPLTDPLQWWKSNSARFPTISKVARDVLGIQASSVASQSVFSILGKIIEPTRSLLSDESVIF